LCFSAERSYNFAILNGDSCKFAGICRYFDEDDIHCKNQRRAINDCDEYLTFELIIEAKSREPTRSEVLTK
jgi:hypothetical protein